MGGTEILVVGLAPSDPAAKSLFQSLRNLGTEIARVGHADVDAAAIASEVHGALQRRPGLLVMVGGTVPILAAGIATGTERSLSGTLPAGAVSLETCDGFALLVASTFVLAIAGGAAELDAAWPAEVGPCLAQWVGRAPHVRGELVVLDAGTAAVEAILATVAAQHPEVYLRTEPANGAGVRVCALAAPGPGNAADAVDLALASVERAASASRLRVASTGRRTAEVVDATESVQPL
jgi:molybdopterin-biosynthesis enzyme MoeA-like protein